MPIPPPKALKNPIPCCHAYGWLTSLTHRSTVLFCLHKPLSLSLFHLPFHSVISASILSSMSLTCLLLPFTNAGHSWNTWLLLHLTMRLGLKITDTVKGKLSLEAKILQVGGVGKVLTQLFSVREGEKLLKALQCYLSTTSSPIAGLLFISTDKVAFCSERSIKISSPKGELIRIHYKIPLEKIKCVNQSQNVKKPSQKYIDIVTVDNFNFWFMGFLNYKKAYRCLHQSVYQA